MLSLHVNICKGIEWNLEPLNAYKKSVDKTGLRTILDLRINNLKGANSSGGFDFNRFRSNGVLE